MPGVSRVLVIGGGIGGLTTATGMALRGVEVDLIELKPDFVVRGVGLGQPANALRALRAIGVIDEVLACGFEFGSLLFKDDQGELITEHRYRLGDARTPALSALKRVDLHRILIGAAGGAGVNIRLGTTVRHWEQDPDGVDVEFSDASTGRYDLLVAFDGNSSGMRRELFGDAYEPIKSEIGAWRVTVDRPDEVREMEFYQGVGSKTGLMPLSADSMYLFHIRREPLDARYRPEDFLDLLRQRTAEYGGAVAEVIDSLGDDDEIVFSRLEPVTLPSPWGRRRVLIAGDAAHACPPHMTQGAAMAMEDGLVLAECVTAPGPIEEQLDRFMARRLPRVSLVQHYANTMLAEEQAVQSRVQLEAAKVRMRQHTSNWLAEADAVLNQPALVDDWSALTDGAVR